MHVCDDEPPRAELPHVPSRSHYELYTAGVQRTCIPPHTTRVMAHEETFVRGTVIQGSPFGRTYVSPSTVGGAAGEPASPIMDDHAPERAMSFADSAQMIYTRTIDQYGIKEYRPEGSARVFARCMEQGFAGATELLAARGYTSHPPQIISPLGVICVICLTQERSVLFTPCNHVCVCRGCWEQWRAEHVMHAPCPMCRVVVECAKDVSP